MDTGSTPVWSMERMLEKLGIFSILFLFSDRKQMTCSIWIPYSDVAGRQGTWEERPHRIIEKGAVSYVFCKSIGWGEYRRI